jgi:hypothetical protein
MAPDDIPWETLRRLRETYLDGSAGAADYWKDDRALAAYDATFAQRIGWKWDHVLADLLDLGWSPPPGHLRDWGCGTGIATRAFLDAFSGKDVTGVHFHDRSHRAMQFAAARLAARFPGVPVEEVPSGTDPAVLLISHVLTELEAGGFADLLDQARRCTALLWVEPGTPACSRRLIEVRETLRDEFHPVAPCPHAHRCGLLEPGQELHWCHQFAAPAPGVFADPFWARFAREMSVDLRSLPLSYLVLDRRPPTVPQATTGSARVLGRAQWEKAGVRVFLCSKETLGERQLTRRAHPDLWKAARKDRFPDWLPSPPKSPPR